MVHENISLNITNIGSMKPKQISIKYRITELVFCASELKCLERY